MNYYDLSINRVLKFSNFSAFDTEFKNTPEVLQKKYWM